VGQQHQPREQNAKKLEIIGPPRRPDSRRSYLTPFTFFKSTAPKAKLTLAKMKTAA
jgi:hypothetical protein